MLHEQGNRFLFIGASDTGKSYLNMMFAKYFRERKISPKRTVIFEHQRNDETYGNVEKYGKIKEITLNDLDYSLPQRGVFRIISRDIDGFLDKAMKMVNTFFVIDDGTSLFRKSVPNKVIQFLGLRKNQRLEIAIQIHTIKAVAPDLLENTDIWVIKQTGDSLPVKDSCPNAENVTKLLRECMTENAKNNYKNMWATRVYIPLENKVYRMETSKPFEIAFKKPVNILINPL